MFQRESGVSPVVAELLIIGITMVVVVSLYLTLTSGIISTPYGTNQLGATLIPDYSKSNSSVISFHVIMRFPSSTLLSKVKITVISGSSIAHLTYQGNFIWSNQTSGSWHYEAKLIDNDGDGKFSNGDTLIVYGEGTNPPPFKSGDKVLFSIDGYNGISAGGVVNF